MDEVKLKKKRKELKQAVCCDFNSNEFRDSQVFAESQVVCIPDSVTCENHDSFFQLVFFCTNLCQLILVR